jgi:Ca2+-binding RTX toxin-like protein
MATTFISRNTSKSVSLTKADTTLVLVDKITLASQTDGIGASGTALDRMVIINGKLTAKSVGVVFGAAKAGDLDGSVVVSETGSITTSGTGIRATADGMEIVNRGTIAGRLSGVEVIGANARVTNEDTIASSAGKALTVAGASAMVVNNGSLSAQTDVVSLTGNRSVMTNNGEIGSSAAAGIAATGTGTIITNNGSIGTRGHGIFATGASEIITNNKTIGSGGSAIIAKGRDVIVTNSGTLTAAADGIALYGDHGVITNRRTIEVGGTGMRVSADGATANNLSNLKGYIAMSGEGDDIRGANSGTMTSTKGVAVDFSKAPDSSFSNTGLIVSAASIAFKGGDGQQSLTNRGSIRGDVDLGAGNDYFDGRGGSVDGSIKGGAGHDTYVVDDAKAPFVEAKDAGNDLVIAHVNYTLRDNFESLTLGGTSTFNATGNGLANKIHGNGAVNRIDGKAGNDTIWGHGGDDVLTGGSGTDQFVFAKGDDRDTITDFAASGSTHDVLDLTGLDTITSFTDFMANHARQVGLDVLIDALNGDSILLKNVKLAYLDKGDFLF